MANLDRKRQYIISQMGEDYIEAGSCELRYQCPFCEEQGLKFEDYKLYVNYAKCAYWCHRCESTGYIAVDDLISRGSNTDVYGALDKYLDFLIPASNNNPEDSEESDYYLIPKYSPIPGTLAWDYILARGITPPEISFYQIRVPGVEDSRIYRGRIVIPNKIISNIWTDMYVGRTYIDDPIRYKNPASSKAHDIVFNLHRIPKFAESLIINEGVINSIVAGTNSVATYGKHVADPQLMAILEKDPKKIYVSLDFDARKQAEVLCDKIKALSSAKLFLVELPDGEDAASLGRLRYLDLVQSAREYTSKSMYMIEGILRSFSDS